MVFSKKKKNDNTTDVVALSQKLQQYEQETAFYHHMIHSLLILLKNFPLDLKEIDTPGFARHVDELTKKIIEVRNLSKTRSFFEKSKNIITSFISRHKAVLGERERDYKEIIELLTKAMAELGSENREYNDEIYKRTENIEKLTLLDDIKTIKNAIKEQVAQIRSRVVSEKEI